MSWGGGRLSRLSLPSSQTLAADSCLPFMGRFSPNLSFPKGKREDWMVSFTSFDSAHPRVPGSSWGPISLQQNISQRWELTGFHQAEWTSTDPVGQV